VLVIAPNLEIRRGISTAFDVAGRECFWNLHARVDRRESWSLHGRSGRPGREHP
jgi:hypothetical protein